MTDRTDDFQALVARARDDPTVQVTRMPRKPQAESAKTALARTKEFNGAASEVAHDIKRTSGQLQELTRLAPERKAEIQDVVALLAQERAVTNELRALQRVRASFMAWKLIHIPAALLLTGLVVVHVVSIWRY